MAALPPPPPPPPPLNLPDDVLEKILARIPCKVDRYRMALVCRAWRGVVERIQQLRPAPRPLPWLLLPSPDSDDGSTRVACVFSGCRVHHFLNITPPWRCFGSHDGAWLFLHFRQPRRHHMLLNVRTGEARLLPDMVYTLANRRVPVEMAIHVAALSAPPGDRLCIAAGIVTSCWQPPPCPVVQAREHGVALWRVRSRRPRARGVAYQILRDDPTREDWQAEDVVYHSGAFHFVTTGNHIRLCSPTLNQDGLLTLGTAGWEERRFDPIVSLYDDQRIHARYLVKSRKELLLVLRFETHPDPAQKWALAFRVFQATQLLQKSSQDSPKPEYQWSWSELHTLGGRMLFVGHGCSRSYETDQYPGFHDGIYFLDDDTFYDHSVVFGFGNGNVMHQYFYSCNDNGKWSEGRVKSCFPSSEPSESSPPAWLLP